MPPLHPVLTVMMIMVLRIRSVKDVTKVVFVMAIFFLGMDLLVIVSACGDGWIVLNEDCDDNNSQSDDGCSSECEIEEYFECIGEPSVC